MPPSSRDLFAAGQTAERDGRLAEAERLYRAALAADPGHGRAHAALGFLALRGGRPDLAQGFLAKARGLVPDLLERQLGEAQALSSARRWREAVDSWRRALAIQSGHADALIGLAECLAQLGRREAVEAAEDAAASAPGDVRLLLRAAAVLTEAGKLDRAAELASRAQALAPADPGPLLRLGHVRRDEGHPSEA
ncbi:MAG: hypothetical protein K0S81_1127, partial [Rhodospirillales bacterium]|nr:hypothetical protein [Rhodospirillales bacterium]